MTTIVLLHGHGVDADIWMDLKKYLPEYDILTPDISTKTQYERIEGYVDDLYQWLVAQKVEQCVLIGHSMGGYITLAFAEKYPAMLQGFGLFHSTAFADDEEKQAQRKKTLRFIETHGAAAFIRQSAPNMYAEDFVKQHPEVIEKHIEQYTQLPTAAVIAGFKAIMSRSDRTQVLQNAAVPVLLIFGKKDKLIAFEKNIGLSELPNEGHTFISAKSGHLGMIEDAVACAEDIRTWMQAL